MSAENNKPLQSLELLKQVLDVTEMLVLILDQDARIVYCNKQAQQATGFKADYLANKNIGEALIRDMQRAGFDELLSRVKDGYTVECESYWRTIDKERYICVQSKMFQYGPDERGDRWLSITGLNITARKTTEQALANSEAQLRAILDAAVDGIISIDDKGTILGLNGAAASMFDYSVEELMGQNVKMLMPEPDRGQHDKYLQNYHETGVAKIIGIGREVTAQRRDGSTFPIDLSVGKVELPGKLMFTGIVRDNTERKKVEQAARMRLTEHAHASRLAALGEMASGIAHELNQPLAAIVSFADASKRLLQGDTPARIELVDDTLGQIAQQGERAGNIIRRLREFVRKGSVEQQLVSVNDIVRDVLNMLEHDLRMQQVAITCHFAKDLPKILADKLQIEQVVLNLVRNAVDAMEHSDEPKIEIEIQNNETTITVTISDTGPGFDIQQKDQLFDAFYTTKANGTGLGLSISHSIIAAHGGELAADSDNNGATFRFTLPLQ